MSSINALAVAVWAVIIIVAIKAFLERDKPPTDNYTPSPDRNANKVVNARERRGGATSLFDLLAYVCII